MKSLLVDVLLQANSGDKSQTLTDSGSHDTTDRELPITANDAVAERGNAVDEAANSPRHNDMQELSLEAAFEVEDTSVEPAAPVPAVTRVAAAIGDGPALARFTPHACLLLAVVTAGFWFAYQHLRLTYSESVLGVSQLRDSAAPTTQTGSVMNSSVASRFPFLEDRVQFDAEEDLE